MKTATNDLVTEKMLSNLEVRLKSDAREREARLKSDAREREARLTLRMWLIGGAFFSATAGIFGGIAVYATNLLLAGMDAIIALL